MDINPTFKKRYLVLNFLAIGLTIFIITLIIQNFAPGSWYRLIEKKFGSLDEEIYYFMIFIISIPFDYLVAKLMQKLSGYNKLKPFLITSLISAAIFSTIMSFLIFVFYIIIECGLINFNCGID